MNNILACIDTRGNTDAVIDWAAWAALRLDAPLEFVHVLERHPELAEVSDLSGAIGIGAQASLLQDLSERDELRSRAQREDGRELLAQARERAAKAGVSRLDAGDLELISSKWHCTYGTPRARAFCVVPIPPWVMAQAARLRTAP